jgi:hypoxanthine phosphoribosyltransferase
VVEVKVLFSEQQVREKVAELAAILREEYRDKHPLIIGILKGSFVFMADLIRVMGIPVEVEFVGLSSYGRGATESTGKIKVVQRLRATVKDRHVLVLEDIVDTGLTIRFLLDYLKRKKPASLKLCALLDKPSRRKIDVPIDYLGFTVPNVFVVGYGIDWDERFRYLPDVRFVEVQT